MGGYGKDTPGLCPHCGVAFTLKGGTLSPLRPGANLRCNTCKGEFWCWKLPGASAFSYADRFKRSMQTWVGPPMKGAQ